MTETTPASPAPTGEQWVLAHGDDELTVVEVGGGLRRWVRHGVDVLAGYGRDEPCTSGRGQQLIPWPNRIRDGRYTLDDAVHQLPLTEVALGNASHGLVRWAPWRLLDRTGTSLTVGHRLHPQPGWDWHLESTTTYAVSPEGLTVATEVVNVGAGRAPFGYGAHPYVAIGDVPVGSVALTVPATRRVEVDERLLPVGTSDVDGTAYDFRVARAVGETRLDTAYTGIEADGDRWTVTVDVPGRGVVDVWGEAAAFPWLQVFTGKAEADQPGEHGVAVEPMTCPAGAFASGEGLIRLDPGQRWTGTWGISPR